MNVHKSDKIGQEQWSKFHASWPDGFHSPIKNDIVAMKSSKKSVKAGEIEIFYTQAIYSQVMWLFRIGRIELEDHLKYELSAVPLSLFDSNGKMRHSTSKADLKNRLQIKTSQRLPSKADVVIINGFGKLWSISWQKNATLRDLAYQMYQHECIKWLISFPNTLPIYWLQTTLRIDLLSPAQKLCPYKWKKEWWFEEIP